MSLLSRLKSNVLLIGLLFGMALLDLMEPLNRMDGWLLIMYGISLASLDRHFNPNPPKAETGPWLPWNQMDAGDRLGYFFPALFFAVPGTLLLMVAGLSSGSITDKWVPLAFAVLSIGGGARIAYDRWRNRWGAVEAE